MLLALLDGQVDAVVTLGVADHPHRVQPLLHLLDLALEHAPVHGNALVGCAQVLDAAVRHPALHQPRRNVLPVDMVHPVLPIGRLEWHFMQMHLLEQARRHGRALRWRIGVVPIVHGVFVIHRHPDLEHIGTLIVIPVAHRQHAGKHDRMAHLPVIAVLALPFQQAVLRNAVLELAKVDLLVGCAQVRLDAILLLQELQVAPMQPFRVHRVQRSLHDLQPVARNMRPAQQAYRTLHHKAVKAR